MMEWKIACDSGACPLKQNECGLLFKYFRVAIDMAMMTKLISPLFSQSAHFAFFEETGKGMAYNNEGFLVLLAMCVDFFMLSPHV